MASTSACIHVLYVTHIISSTLIAINGALIIHSLKLYGRLHDNYMFIFLRGTQVFVPTDYTDCTDLFIAVLAGRPP